MPRGPSIGFLGRFGRSTDLKRLDAALREHDLHPSLVPEGAKLALVRLMKDHVGEGADRGAGAPSPEAYSRAAAVFAYCVLGREHFEQFNGARRTGDAEARIRAALDDGDGFDAGLVLLAIHAKLIAGDVVNRFDLSAEEA